MSVGSTSSRMMSGAALCFFVLPFITGDEPVVQAEYDPVLDAGTVDGYPQILWLKDHDDVTGCCNGSFGNVNTRFLRRDQTRNRVDAVFTNRDFIYVFVSGYQNHVAATPGGGTAFYWGLCRTEISGLLGPGPCGPNDTLQGIMMMGRSAAYWTEVQETQRRYVLLHELGHRWGALCETSTPGTDIGFGHWFTYFPPGETPEFFDIESIMDDTPLHTSNFAVLDLYLMGLADPSEVPDYNYFPGGGTQIPVTIESIIEGTGVRNPAYPNAPTNFTAVFVVVAPEDRVPSPEDMANLESWRNLLPGWWAAATDDRSTLEVTLSTCGDGVLELGEGCDDGNVLSGDGCSSSCMVDEVLPAVSTWGLVWLSLMALIVGSIMIPRGRAVPQN